MVKAKLIGIAPQLIVQDVSRSADYYRNMLSFTILGIVGNPPVYAMVERDGCQVHFAKSAVPEIHVNRDFLSISHDFILWAPEIDALFEEWKQKGVKIIQEITRRPYGSREFVIEDIDGHIILVGD
jgi:uncharacterized glyoxalase superfamily protein PhnB